MNKILDKPWQVALVVVGIYLGTALAMEWWDRQKAAQDGVGGGGGLPCGCGGGK